MFNPLSRNRWMSRIMVCIVSGCVRVFSADFQVLKSNFCLSNTCRLINCNCNCTGEIVMQVRNSTARKALCISSFVHCYMWWFLKTDFIPWDLIKGWRVIWLINLCGILFGYSERKGQRMSSVLSIPQWETILKT